MSLFHHVEDRTLIYLIARSLARLCKKLLMCILDLGALSSNMLITHMVSLSLSNFLAE